jgi:type II secretory pathway component PulL
LSLFVGIFVGRPAGQKLLQLMQQHSPTSSVAELAQRERLRKRAALSSWLTAILLLLAVLSMATFRYVQALA